MTNSRSKLYSKKSEEFRNAATTRWKNGDPDRSDEAEKIAALYAIAEELARMNAWRGE